LERTNNIALECVLVQKTETEKNPKTLSFQKKLLIIANMKPRVLFFIILTLDQFPAEIG
jgi:hypothetical protein